MIGVYEQAVTVGVLAGCSDSIAQKLSGIQKLQFKRLLLKVVCHFSLLKPSTHLLSMFGQCMSKMKFEVGVSMISFPYSPRHSFVMAIDKWFTCDTGNS